MARDSQRSGFRPRSAAGPQLQAGPAAAGAALLRRSDQLGVGLAERPLAVLGGILALNLGLAACFVGAGGLAGDQALLFREGAPGTMLSFCELLLIAAVAAAIHRRARRTVPGGGASGASRQRPSRCSRSTRSRSR